MGNEFKDLFGDWEPSKGGGPGDESAGGELENRVPRDLEEKEVRVAGVYEHPAPGTASAQTCVLLQDGRGRKVFIFIGRFEAYAISLALEGEETERPLTHDLIRILIERLNGKVERVVIDDIWSDTFYAKLTVRQGDRSSDIDCRPSDAIAIALRAKAPIYMAEAVIESSQQEP